MEQGNNNPDEKIRQEISMLSRLIASGGQAPGPPSSSRTSTIIPSASYAQPYRHHQYQRPLSFVNSTSNNTGWPSNIRSHLPQYTNPFRLKSMQDYASKIFPTSYQISTGSVSANIHEDHGRDGYCVDSSYSHAKSTSTNPFKIVRNRAKKVVLGPSLGTSASSLVNRDIVLEPAVPHSTSSKAKANVPTSVYINPALLLSSNSNSCQDSSSNVPKSSFIIRPHINPDHYAYRQLPTTSVAGSSGTSTASSGKGSGCSDLPIVSSSVIHLKDHSRSLGLTSLNLNSGDQYLNRQPVIKSKYKVDRRPRRRQSYSKAESPKRASLNSRRMKIVKKYSTMLVPQPSPSVLSRRNFNPHSFRRTSLHHLQKEFHKLTRLTSNYSRSLKGAYRLTVSKPHSPKKSIVRIGGNKYLRKNSGMTLKKIKQRSPAVLNIGGSHFISKNSGKSLKRLSRPKSLSISLSQTPATPGVRLAHRAVIKSKVTLSQRTWRKKRFCVYYNQLGVCKKDEEGNCPFNHDKKQLSICPKFIVGKCTVSDCKLSHDINVGRMPACQFFNKSKCSRENCPYPHIKTTTFKRKSSGSEIIVRKDDKDSPQKCSGTPRKRKSPTNKEITPKSKSKKRKQENPKEQDKSKSRYYDQSPASQPTISIIPRRIRPVSEDPSTVQKPNNGSHLKNSNNAIHAESNQAAQPQVEISASPKSLQRARLMKKVSRLQEKVKPKPKESTAPQFLSFK